MAKAKSSTTTMKKSQASKSAKSKATSVCDIKSPIKKDMKNVFTIKQMDDAPDVEPLLDDDKEIEYLDKEIEDIEQEMEDESENLDISYESSRKPVMKIDSLGMGARVERFADSENTIPKDTIKVKFGTFVGLIANHDMEDVVAANVNKEIIMDSNLLTELASSRDRREERKIPLVFLVGIAIGVVLTYIFFST